MQIYFLYEYYIKKKRKKEIFEYNIYILILIR